MSKIFELFGYRVDQWDAAADANRAKAWCPFMDAECDGGGNRHSSAINLEAHADLRQYFPGKQKVQSGVCSLRIVPGEQPWIVCPRRLFSMRSSAEHQRHKRIKEDLVHRAGLPFGKPFRVWSEVKMKVATLNAEEEEKSFDYTFDYVIAGSQVMRLSAVAELLDESTKKSAKIAKDNGYTTSIRDGELCIEDFPGDPAVIVEIMTSSTSGGDKNKRTQIAMAFEDAVRHGLSHNGPTINYRQVWARMVSQLIVKSQVGLAWGGKTFWLVQDVLADYISASTALDLAKYLAEHPSEVNIMAIGYGAAANRPVAEDGITPFDDYRFYAGKIGGSTNAQDHGAGFVDIVKLGAPPPKTALWRSLFLKRPKGAVVREQA